MTFPANFPESLFLAAANQPAIQAKSIDDGAARRNTFSSHPKLLNKGQLPLYVIGRYLATNIALLPATELRNSVLFPFVSTANGESIKVPFQVNSLT